MARSPRPTENKTPRFRLRRAAADDLLAIAEYTIERWGEAQADAYIGQLDRTFHELAAKPDMGKNADDVRSGYLRKHVGRHMIYYRRVRGGIEIVRVLHDRMSPRRHL